MGKVPPPKSHWQFTAPKSPFWAAHLNNIAAFHPDNESRGEKELLKCKCRTITSSKRLHAACVVQPACSEIPKWFTKAAVYRLQKFYLSWSFLPAREDRGCTKVRRFGILNSGSLRCCWLCWTWQVLLYGNIQFLLTRFPEFAEWIGIKKSHECLFKTSHLRRFRAKSASATTGKPSRLLKHTDGAEIECGLFVGFRFSSLLVP